MNRPAGYEKLNQFSRIIVDEALRRGIAVELLDPSTGEMALSLDGRRVTTVQSLSELTSAVAFRRCDDKAYTRRVLSEAGLTIPEGRTATFDRDDLAFLEQWKDIVVKPVRGEQGDGVTVGVVDADGLAAAVAKARSYCPEVLLERRCEGDDLRVVVIGDEVVAASVRRAAEVTGTGAHTVAELIEDLSQTRQASVPLDDTTREVVQAGGHHFDSVLAEDTVLPVRRTANVHTGGSIDDVTDQLHPELRRVALAAARAIGIPVVGIDLMVDAVDEPDYVIIEANEQPGLANHEPQPTAERFIDLLFPESAQP